jgi:hypothetical protein
MFARRDVDAISAHIEFLDLLSGVRSSPICLIRSRVPAACTFSLKRKKERASLWSDQPSPLPPVWESKSQRKQLQISTTSPDGALI